MFEVGQIVICVDGRRRHANHRGPYPTEGLTYTIKAITHQGGGVLLQELETADGFPYYADRFRPLGEKPEKSSTKTKTDISVFHRILDEVKKGADGPVKVQEEEKAK